MQLLIVHRDADFGQQLVQMVKDYTAHECDLAPNAIAALQWARQNRQCSILLTQLDAQGIDGLALAGSLAEIFPSLQTMFLPGYPASAQRLEVTNPKVFPEPIDGERLLEAIARGETASGLDLFHVADILQMCCLSGKSGALQAVKNRKIGIVYLRDGKIVDAEIGVERGPQALREIVALDFVEFAYDPKVRAEAETISAAWDKILFEAVLREKERSAPLRRQSIA